MSVSKIEEYQAKAAESLAALGSAANARDRAFHGRAYGIYRRLIDGIGEAEERAQSRAPANAAKPR